MFLLLLTAARVSPPPKTEISDFSIVFFDIENHKVFLARDRLGQKPLYYFQSQSRLLFSSTLTSLLKLFDHKEIEIEKQNLITYLDLGMIPAPNTPIKKIFKVQYTTTTFAVYAITILMLHFPN